MNEHYTETVFESITIQYENKIVRITCDSALMNYLELPGNGSVPLAEHILKTYEHYFHKPLLISLHSLAIEILGHVYADKFASCCSDLAIHLSNEQSNCLKKMADKLLERTSIIDCGEKSVDNNRFIWDFLEPLHSFIYMLLGKNC